MFESKVSIVIPVYNVKQYVQECVDSLLMQTYKNIEIILVDDGSYDGSASICDSYGEKYNNIMVYHLKNSGVSNARNYGIKKSTGKFITFVDSDDFIEKDTIKKMVDAMLEFNVQMVACGYKRIYKNYMEESSYTTVGKHTNTEACKEIFKEKSIKGFSCAKMYNREIIINCGISFDTEITMCEDLLFVYQYINNISNIYIIDNNLYNYRMRKSSASNSKKEDETVLIAVEKMIKVNSEFYNYAGYYYYYLYCKFHKLFKNTNQKKITVFSILCTDEISLKQKFTCIINRFFPVGYKKNKKYVFFE